MVMLSALIWEHTSIAPNMGWWLNVADSLLKGQVLYRDIIEVNFPLIYYAMTLPVWISHLTTLDSISTTKFLSFALTIISYLFSLRILRHHHHTEQSLRIAVTFGLFILPFMFSVPIFAEKEHLFIVATLPYLFSCLCGNTKQPLPKYQSGNHWHRGRSWFLHQTLLCYFVYSR